jgi:hypothetical protein
LTRKYDRDILVISAGKEEKRPKGSLYVCDWKTKGRMEMLQGIKTRTSGMAVLGVCRLRVNLTLSLMPLILLLLLPGFLGAFTITYEESKTVPLYEALKTNEKWHATTYDIKDADKVHEFCGVHNEECKDSTGEVPTMRLCFWHDPSKKERYCYRIDNPIAGGKPTKEAGSYVYDHAGQFSVVRLCDTCPNRYGLELQAVHTGSRLPETKSMLSIWVYDPKDGKFVNIIPRAWISEQGTYKIIPSLRDGIEGIVLVCEAIPDWLNGFVSRYAPHRFYIHIYQMDKDGRYRRIGLYKTKKRYPSYDDADEIKVIEPELANIKRFIMKIKGR